MLCAHTVFTIIVDALSLLQGQQAGAYTDGLPWEICRLRL